MLKMISCLYRVPQARVSPERVRSTEKNLDPIRIAPAKEKEMRSPFFSILPPFAQTRKETIFGKASKHPSFLPL